LISACRLLPYRLTHRAINCGTITRLQGRVSRKLATIRKLKGAVPALLTFWVSLRTPIPFDLEPVNSTHLLMLWSNIPPQLQRVGHERPLSKFLGLRKFSTAIDIKQPNIAWYTIRGYRLLLQGSPRPTALWAGRHRPKKIYNPHSLHMALSSLFWKKNQ